MAEATAPDAPTRKLHPQSIKAEKRFLAALAEIGAIPLYDEWKGSQAPHHVQCANGHDSWTWPSGLFRGQGICRECAGLGSKSAWEEFQSTLTSAGGKVLEEQWLGSTQPHKVMCAAGHTVTAIPHNVKTTGRFCSACAGRNADASWDTFRSVVAKNGGTVLEQEWLGTHTPHRIICAGKHKISVRPSKVAQHDGVPCRFCKGKARDAFYVVRDEASSVVKVGITSGNPRPRLLTHARGGFDEVVRVFAGLPGTTAPDLERNILAALEDAGEEPVRGREYFRDCVLPLVLDLVDNHPQIRDRPVS